MYVLSHTKNSLEKIQDFLKLFDQHPCITPSLGKSMWAISSDIKTKIACMATVQ